jgi:hypothetical protein
VIVNEGDYMTMVLHHPITMLGVFTRHVVNGLDQRYPTPYVEELDTTGSNRFLRLAGFLLVFLALLRVLWPAARKQLGVSRWRYPVALLLACATSIPSAIETRFMLPAYLLCYLLVVAAPWPNPIGRAQRGVGRFRTAAIVGAAYLAFTVAVILLVERASAHLQFG